jgi:outer membrane protein assembly factor BamB
MMRPGRSAYVWLTAAVLAGVSLPSAVRSQVITPAPPGLPAPEPEGAHAASTRELVKRLHRARQLLEDKNDAEAVRLLQAILENDEDAFYFPDQEDKTKERSLKLEAQTLLGDMPEEGRDVYEKQYGPAARRLFEEAVRLHDAEGLALVARRYFHTSWGYEAAYRLAADHLDHERAQTAALCFERLRSVPRAADRFEPYLSIKTALSWMQAGSNERAIQVLAELKAAHRGKSLTLGGRDVPLFDDPARALAWLTALAGVSPTGPAATADQWPLVGGDSRRNAVSAGGGPYLNRFWRSVTTVGATPTADNDALVARTFHERRPAVAPDNTDDPTTAPLLSSFLPLIVDDLVIGRSIGDVRAYELATGKLVWATGEKDQLLVEMLRAPAVPQAQLAGTGPLALLLANRGWEDATFGALSSDGESVFAIEDLGMGMAGLVALRAPALRDYNRLVAYDVKTGRAMWEVGGPRSENAEPLDGTCFLGAPLILDRRLYVLGESGSEVRLFVLDPRNGRLEWVQTVNADTGASNGLFTRGQSGLSPSYSGEILVCPVGSDQVVAVDVTRRSLAWRHKFFNVAEMYDPRRQQALFVQQQRLIAAQGGSPIDQNRWLDSLALIADMRVVVTPRDTNDIYCLNLLDGSLVWKKPRGEGLFVAGIHQGKVLVVGRSYVQALNLTDGEPSWPEPASIPVPSGRGFVAGDYLHLPLATAEVATISLRDGRVVARARSLAGNVPGNLVAVRGTVVSQGPDFVEAFRQLDALETEIADALARNPADAQALALRGEIELQRGKFGEAYADLKRVLELKSDDAAVRSLLVGSLLEGLRVDFGSYRRLEADIERLLTEPEERSAFLWLTAQGLKRAGESRAALAALLRFGDPQVSDRELERVDGALVVRRDRLVRARAGELYASASPAIRREMDDEYRARVEALQEKKDLPAIRRFLQYFGDLADTGGLPQLSVELPSPDGDWLDDELRIAPLGDSPDDQVAAAATARMAQLLLAAERPRDALAFIRRLETKWPDTACLDGKTGRALAEEWLKRNEIQRELALDASWPSGLVEVERIGPIAGISPTQRAFEVPIAGDRRPFFNDTALYVNTNWKDFFARDGLGRQLWKVVLDTQTQPINVLYNRAWICGHFLLISVGAQVLAIDTLGTADQPGARLLWKINLSSAGRGNAAPRVLGGNARRRIMPFNQFGEQVGSIGPVTRRHVTLLNGHKLMAVEPLTGKPLWMREGVAPGTDLFGDEELLYAVAPGGGPAVVYNPLDGTILGNRALPPERPRLDYIGRRIVTRQVRDAHFVVALHDPWSARDEWSRTFEDGSEVALVESDEVAVLEPSGKFTVLSLADGRMTFESATDPEPQIRQLYVIRSHEHYVLIANQVAGNAIPGVQWQQVTPQAVAVRGRVYGFDRASGKRLWKRDIERHGIDLHQPSELPILALMSSFTPLRPNGQGQESGLTIIDKRNGQVVFDDRKFDEPLLFIDYGIDIEQKQLELRLFKSTLRLTFTDKPLPN